MMDLGKPLLRMYQKLKKVSYTGYIYDLGEHAEKYPELLKEEAKCLLFTLGNHTYHHKDLTKLSIKEGKNEIAKMIN